MIDEDGLGIQSIYACGKNVQSLEKLRRLKDPGIANGRCLVFGFSNDLPLLMASSDVFIGKPGPFSIFECLEIQLPMLLELNYKTLIHERFNARFACDSGFGTTFRSPAELITVLHHFLAEETEYDPAPTSSAVARHTLRRTIEETLKQ